MGQSSQTAVVIGQRGERSLFILGLDGFLGPLGGVGGQFGAILPHDTELGIDPRAKTNGDDHPENHPGNSHQKQQLNQGKPLGMSGTLHQSLLHHRSMA